MSQIIEVPGQGQVEFPDGMSDADIVAAIKKNSMAPAPKAAPGPGMGAVALNSANQAIAGIPDSLLNLPTNIWNLAKAGFGSAATALGKPNLAPDLTQTPDYVRRGMTAAGFIDPNLKPSTAGGNLAGAAASGAVTGMASPAASIPQLIGNTAVGALSGLIGQGTEQITGSPALGQSAAILTPIGVAGAANIGRNAVDAQNLRKAQNAEKDANIREVQDAGYVTPPSAVNPTFLGNRLESMAGKAAVGQESSYRNQQVTNNIARKEAGLSADTPITAANLAAARTKMAAPYRELEAIDPIVAADVKRLQQTRFDANNYWKHYDVSSDPKSLETARTLSARAEAIEQQLEAAAVNAGKPELVNELRQARKSIAKNFDVDRALNDTTSDVSAKKIAKSDVASEGLGTIKKFAEAFGPYAQDGAKIPTPGVSKSEALVSLLAGVGGTASLGPWGALLAAAPLASGPARSLVLSGPYQRLMAKPDYNPGSTASLLSRLPVQDAALRGLVQGALYQ